MTSYIALSPSQRTLVALLNVAFTAGALITPAVVATALRWGSDAYAAFYVAVLIAALTALYYLFGHHLPCLNRDPSVLPSAEASIAASSPLAAGTSDSADEPLATHLMASRFPSRECVVISSLASVRWHALLTLPIVAVHPAPVYMTPSQQRTQSNVLTVGTNLLRQVLFASIGIEHVIATWLPSFGTHLGGVTQADMALMSSCFWSAIGLCRGAVQPIASCT